MKMSLAQLILLGIPEGIGVITVAFVIANVELKWKKIFILGSILAISAYLLRLLPITFGVHTIVYIGLLIFIIKEHAKIDVINAIVYSLVIMLILIISETITSFGLMHLLQTNPKTLNENFLLKILVFYPHVIILFGLAFLLYKHKRKGKYELFENQ